MTEITVSKGSMGRVKRIQELKSMSQQEAIDYAISLTWLHEERVAEKKRKS